METDTKKKSTGTPLITALWIVGVFLTYIKSPIGYFLLWGLMIKALAPRIEKYRRKQGSKIMRVGFDFLLAVILLTLSILGLTLVVGLIGVARYGG